MEGADTDLSGLPSSELSVSSLNLKATFFFFFDAGYSLATVFSSSSDRARTFFFLVFFLTG
jgi:hypothetical protein